jgi:hypothetical protein
LIVLSYDPDTILVPSGENATEKILLAVGVRLLAQLHHFACQTSQQASVLAKDGQF